MNATQKQIIDLLEEIKDVSTIKRRVDLFRLTVQYAKEISAKMNETYIIEELEASLYNQGSDLSYIFHAYVLYCNQIYEIYAIGRLHTQVIHEGSTGGYDHCPYAPEINVGHAWFDTVLTSIAGDPEETPVSFPEKDLMDLVLNMAKDHKFEELVD